jgi:sulfatase maturation enzyme AslB (radical SAM superfamily)
MNNKTFCILPWIHTHVNTEGDVFPCCISWDAGRKAQVGFLKDNTLEELFNSDFMKQLRLDMMSGKERPDVCTSCYDREAGGFKSARVGHNKEFEHLKNSVLNKTESDGFLEPKIISWDIRFSNLCNLKCRTCGPLYSTTWAQEVKKQGREINIKIQAVQDGAPDPLLNQYDHVERIYFAGGEPLIMPEHFRTLQELIDRNRAKDIRLVYNSNLTKLDYNNHNLLEYWRQFQHVVIGVSLDAIGNRAEYIRNGIPWKTIELNLKKLMDFKTKSSKFDFYYSPTVSLLNIHHLPDMHRYLWENKLMPHIGAISFNLLLYPLHYDCRVLSADIKNKIIEKITQHEIWLKNNNAMDHTIAEFANLKSYLEQPANGNELPNLFRKTQELDVLRDEDFYTTFPEYISLKGLSDGQ